VPVYTVSTIVPLGVPSAENDEEPEYVRRMFPPEVIAPNVEETPVPQVIAPLETPHVPLLVLNVTELPEVVKVMVAHVCVLHVPLVRRQPIPDESRRNPLLGIPVTTPPLDVVVVVGVGV